MFSFFADLLKKDTLESEKKNKKIENDNPLEKRNFHRVIFTPPLEGFAKIIAIEGKKVNLEKSIKISIIDMSIGGMRIKTNLDVPTYKDIIFEFKCSLENENFNLKGEIVWKRKNGNTFEYGAQFIEFSPKQEERIAKCINQYELKKVKNKEVKPKKNLSNISSALLKMLNYVSYPAFLITRDYNIIGANAKGKEFLNFKYKEKCYKVFFNRNDVCPKCKIREALYCADEIEDDFYYKNERYKRDFIHLENGIVLVFFKKVSSNIKKASTQ